MALTFENVCLSTTSSAGAWPEGRTGRQFASRCRVADAISYAPDDDDGGDAIMRPIVESLSAVGHTPTIMGGR